MISIRAASLPNDLPGIDLLDTSFESASIVQVSRNGMSFHLVEEPLTPSFTKCYPLNPNDPEERASWDVLLVAEDEGRICGFAAGQYSPWNRRFVIHHLYVDTRDRGKGIGSLFLDALNISAIQYGARSLWVETQNVNVPAVKFYLRSGFSLCGLDTGLYDPATAEGVEVALFLERPMSANGP